MYKFTLENLRNFMILLSGFYPLGAKFEQISCVIDKTKARKFNPPCNETRGKSLFIKIKNVNTWNFEKYMKPLFYYLNKYS